MADTESSTVLDVSQQLDLLIVEYFHSLAEIFKYKQLLENDIKDGFVYMAKVTAKIFIRLFLKSHCNAFITG